MVFGLIGFLLVPGLRAWRSGQPGLARLVATVSAGCVVAAVTMITVSGGLIGVIAVPWGLPTLAGINLVLLGSRLLEVHRTLGPASPAVLDRRSTVPTRRHEARRLRRAQLAHRVVAATAAAVVILPHTAAATELERTRRTLNETFQTETPEAAQVLGAVEDRGSTGHDPAGMDRALGGVDTTRTNGPEIESEVPSDGTLDVLLIGLDSGQGRKGARNDANLVVSIDPITADTTLIGIPRNMVQLPDPWATNDCRCFRPALFMLYGHGLTHADRYPETEPDTGAAAIRDVVGELLGRHIDHYVVADMEAFLALIDALGGVTVELSEPVRDENSHPTDSEDRVRIALQPGTHRLDGPSALAFARMRRDSDDYRRMERQRCLVANSIEPARDFGAWEAWRLASEVRGQLHTDVGRADVPALLELARRVGPATVRSIGLVPPDFVSGRVDGYPIPDREAILAVFDQPADRAPEAFADDGC